MKKYSFLFLLVFFLLGCEKKMLLYNTGNEALVFTVDDRETKVPAGAGVIAWIKPGKHTVKVKNMAGNYIADTTVEVKNGGLFNPFRAEYILKKQAYIAGTMDADNYADKLKEDFITIDSVMYFGSLAKYPAVYFHERDWDYDPQEALPEQIVMGKNEDFRVASKLFRKTDFLAQSDEMLLTSMLDSLINSSDSLDMEEELIDFGDEEENQKEN